MHLKQRANTAVKTLVIKRCDAVLTFRFPESWSQFPKKETIQIGGQNLVTFHSTSAKNTRTDSTVAVKVPNRVSTATTAGRLRHTHTQTHTCTHRRGERERVSQRESYRH